MMTEEEYLRNSKIANIVYDYIKRGIGCDYDIFNSPPPPIPIRPVKIKTLKERLEDNKMKATSTENFHDVIAIDLELQTFPNPDVNDKFIVSATNRDDIFCFVFEGPHIADTCRKAGLFTNWEKDQKIKELEAKSKDISNDNALLLETNKKLKKENEELEKELESIRGYIITETKRLRKKCDADNKLQEEPKDNVNHPSHYTGKYECIDVMQDVFGDEATDNFCLCNAFKYIWRARKKNGLEDVKKAVWYLNKYIEEAEKDGVRKGERI